MRTKRTRGNDVVEVPGVPGSMFIPGPMVRKLSKIEQQEMALVGPAMEALMVGDMETYRKLGKIYRNLERKRKAKGSK